jgi:hypothetical protein
MNQLFLQKNFMKQKLRLLYILPVALIITAVFNGCQKDADTPTPIGTTVAQDKAFLNQTTANTNQCIQAARDGNFSQSVIKFLNLSNGTVGNENWVDSMQTALENVMGTIELDPNNNKFNYASYWGTYNYNRVTKTFTKTAATGIFINIPSEPSKLTNNVSFSFTQYTDGLYQANAKDIYLPKLAKAFITKDGTTIADLNFSGNYSSGNFPRPISVNYSIVLAPHTYTLAVTEVNSLQFKLNSAFISGNGCGINVNATVTFKNDDYNNLKIEDDLKTVVAEYKSGDFSIKSAWDAAAYYAISNPTTANLNASLKNEVYNQANKIADLKFVDVAGNRELFVYYKDGSSENSSAYYDPFTTNLKTTLRPLFGDDVDNWF